MKNLKRLIPVAMVLMMATETFAQSFYARAGFNMANMLMKDNDDTYSDDYKSKAGFQLGATVEFPFSDMFSLETGLGVSTKGFRFEEKEDFFGQTIEIKASNNLVYLDIPIVAKMYFDAGRSARIYGALGPYIGLGIAGKMKAEVTAGGSTDEESEKIKWGSDEEKDDFKPLDLGLLIGAGVEFDAIQVGLSYGLGLANISPYTENGAKAANRVFAITFAYRFAEL